jgi:hypothetical protein
MDIVINNPDLLKIILSFVSSSRQVFLFRGVNKLWKSICEKTAVWFRLAPIFATKESKSDIPYSIIDQPFIPKLLFFYSATRSNTLSEKIISVGPAFSLSKRIEFQSPQPNSRISNPAEWRVLKIFTRTHDQKKLKHTDTYHDDFVTPGLLHLQKEGLLSLNAWIELGKLLFVIFHASSHGEDRANLVDVKIPESFPAFDSPALNDTTIMPALTNTNGELMFSTLHFVDWGSGFRSSGGYRRRLYFTEIRLVNDQLQMKSVFKTECEEHKRGVLVK